MEKELQMVFNYLDAIAAKLGIGAESIWPWFVKQQYIEAAYSSVWLVVMATAAYTTVRFALKHWDHRKTNEGYSISRSGHEPIWVILSSAFGFGLLTSLGIFAGKFVDIFNPQYAALQDIINMIAKLN